MKEFEVVYEGTVRETYYVFAETEEEANELWSEEEPSYSEVIDGDVVSVEEVE
mgnify:CR=1 FL=1